MSRLRRFETVDVLLSWSHVVRPFFILDESYIVCPTTCLSWLESGDNECIEEKGRDASRGAASGLEEGVSSASDVSGGSMAMLHLAVFRDLDVGADTGCLTLENLHQ